MSFVHKSTALVAVLFCLIAAAAAQQRSAPREERLINGLRVLLWPDQTADRVTVKVRVHSGTSFDPLGKEGVMTLLSESFYPTPAARVFFREDLGGGLNVDAKYDYIQITGWSNPEEFLTLMESISSAVVNTQIDKETTPKLVAEVLERIKALEANPAYIAKSAAAKQLFGAFPYGRPELGTLETVEKLGFADLLDAKQRFLNADNATVSISGKFDPASANRVTRRLFGAWLKSDKIAPSTFKQPDAPDTKPLVITAPVEAKPHQQFALRGVARAEKDYAAAEILRAILESRVKENMSGAADVYVTNAAHFLPGSFVAGATLEGEPFPANLLMLLLSKSITTTEFETAKARVLDARRKAPADEVWLDVDTYKLKSAADDQKAFDTATVADVQRVAERLAKNPVVSVTVMPAEKTATTSN